MYALCVLSHRGTKAAAAAQPNAGRASTRPHARTHFTVIIIQYEPPHICPGGRACANMCIYFRSAAAFRCENRYKTKIKAYYTDGNCAHIGVANSCIPVVRLDRLISQRGDIE